MPNEEIQRGTAITTAEYNKLKAKADRLDELLVIYKRHYGNVIKYAIELQEKAELWDQYAIYDNEKEEEILVKDLITAYEKLEAIKTWAKKELSENSRIADAKYEEVMEGRDEAPELNYYTGKRDQTKELLKILEKAELVDILENEITRRQEDTRLALKLAERLEAVKKLVEKGPSLNVDTLEDCQQAVDDWLGKLMNVLDGEA